MMAIHRASLWPRILLLGMGCGALLAGLVAIVSFIERKDGPVHAGTDSAEPTERAPFFEDPASFKGKEVKLTAFVFPMLPSGDAPVSTDAPQAETFEITSTPITQGNVMFYVVRAKGRLDEVFAQIPDRAAITPGILANQRVVVSFFCADGDLRVGNVVRSMSPLPR